MFSILQPTRTCSILVRSFLIRGQPYFSPLSSLQSSNNYHSSQKQTILRSDVAKHIATKHGMSLEKATLIIRDALDFIIDNVANNKLVKLSLFGKFEKRLLKPKIGRNFATGEQVDVPAMVRPVFRPLRGFKDHVKNKHVED
mmetsp:Transcript_28083/g.41488  ORF Transcript_28083/g.41488 Transcript_28083/m.41488 type:complete len:142 (-) Transcript_28083:193-618(-)